MSRCYLRYVCLRIQRRDATLEYRVGCTCAPHPRPSRLALHTNKRPVNDNRDMVRHRLQQARLNRATNDYRASESSISDMVESVLEGHAPGVVAGYLAHRGEIDLGPTLKLLNDLGWQIVLPVCAAKAQMNFSPWSPGDELTPNRYGIDEPTSPSVYPVTIDVVLTPGVGFDDRGARLGNGVGYYDRFFARCFELEHNPLRIGVGHEFQVVDEVPTEQWDVPMDMVITPDRIIDLTTENDE